MPSVSVAGLRLTTVQCGVLVATLLAFLALYLAYRVLYRPDFGMPVRRRLLVRGFRMRREEFAEVPIWWSALQVERAVRSHWKASLRMTVRRPGRGSRRRPAGGRAGSGGRRAPSPRVVTPRPWAPRRRRSR
ncbi:MAG: hypothetical protein ABSA40_07490 [Candidatus Dormibacteria bacterium]|jgi:hypothetical protein